MLNSKLERPLIITPLPGPSSKRAATQLVQMEATGISAIKKGATPTFWKEASGAVVEDIDGNLFFDCTSSFGVASVGYNHPRVTRALSQQCTTLVHTMSGIYPQLPYLDALQSIVTTVGRWKQTEVLLTNTGSEAIEVALKLSARCTEKQGVIAFHGAFHGQTLGVLSVTSFNKLRDPFASLLPHNVLWVPYPNPYRPPLGSSPSSVIDACLQYLERQLRADNVGGPAVGAIIVEPIQNSSGYIIPPEGFLKGLRELCKQYNVLLILDEIFTGFGRTGEWLAEDRENVVADIVCIGKGMTGGIASAACIADNSIMAALQCDEIVALHGSTFAANPLACAAIAATIEVLISENLVDRAKNLGEEFLFKVTQICEKFPCVGDVRGIGAGVVIEFVKSKQSKERDNLISWKVMQELFTRGVITLVTGLPYGNILGFYPPFVITAQQVDYVVEALSESLKTTVEI